MEVDLRRPSRYSGVLNRASERFCGLGALPLALGVVGNRGSAAGSGPVPGEPEALLQAQLHLRTLFILFLSPLPPGGPGGGSKFAFSLEYRGCLADFGPNPVREPTFYFYFGLKCSWAGEALLRTLMYSSFGSGGRIFDRSRPAFETPSRPLAASEDTQMASENVHLSF